MGQNTDLLVASGCEYTLGIVREGLTADGTVAAEPIPCNARITFRDIELGAKPLPRDHAKDHSVPSKNTFLRPKRSASLPNKSKKHP